MAEIYQCGNCNNEVKFGAKFCDECGTKLEWPKEKVAKVKVIKTKKKSKKVKLDVDPDVVEKLNKDCIWTIVLLYVVGILGINYNIKVEWIIPMILIVSLLNSIYILPLILLRIGVGKWLKSVKDPDNNPEYPTNKMLGRAKGIIIYTIIVGALFLFAFIGSLITQDKPKNYFDQTDYASQKNTTITMDLLGLMVVGGLAFKAYKVIQSSKTGEKYEYDPNKQQEIESVEIADNSTSEEEDDEDEDEDYDF